MRKLVISILSLGSLFLGSFSQAQTETSGREDLYRATHTKVTELKHTKLKVNFDFSKEEMNGEEWLTASPYFYPSNNITLDAKGMLIHNVSLEKNGKLQPVEYQYKNNILSIKLDKTYQRNEDYTLYIKYTARPNQVQSEDGENMEKGLYFINPKGENPYIPTQIWTQGETESSSAWFPTIDKPNQKTTQEIYISVPDKFVTLSNGLLKSSQKDGNIRTDHWVMDKRHSPYLFFMGVGEYAIVKDKWRNIDVDYYVEKEYEPYATQTFGNTPEMMEFFSKLLKYDFPWAKYSQIVGRNFESGAMENTTAVIHNESANLKAGDLADENTWETVVAHELFHHWFGDLVTTESWANLTVNESFANYSEYLWLEHKYGKDEAEYHINNDISSYIHTKKSHSKNLVRFNYDHREDMFDNVSYNKGGYILNMLRNYLGDEAFFEGMHQYLKENEYNTGEAHQVRLAFEKVSGKDLNWFFNQWYFGSEHPIVQSGVSYNPIKKDVSITIEQIGMPFQFPLNIDIYEKGTPKRVKVWVEAKEKNTFTFPSNTNPDFININPDGLILMENKDIKTDEQQEVIFANTADFYTRYITISNIVSKKTKNVVDVRTLVKALKDPSFRVRKLALMGIDLNNPLHLKLALSEVEKLAQKDPKTLVKGQAILALAKTKRSKYLPIYEKGLMEVSNSVKSASLEGIIGLNPQKIKEYAEKIDLESASVEAANKLLPSIVEYKVQKLYPIIGQVVAFYPFIEMNDPKLGAIAEKGFNLIMESDDVKAMEAITKIFRNYTSVFKEPQVRGIIVEILKNGLAKKVKLLRENPQSNSLNVQVESIQKVIDEYQK